MFSFNVITLSKKEKKKDQSVSDTFACVWAAKVAA